jgi:hypothetical protein
LIARATAPTAAVPATEAARTAFIRFVTDPRLVLRSWSQRLSRFRRSSLRSPIFLARFLLARLLSALVATRAPFFLAAAILVDALGVFDFARCLSRSARRGFL